MTCVRTNGQRDARPFNAKRRTAGAEVNTCCSLSCTCSLVWTTSEPSGQKRQRPNVKVARLIPDRSPGDQNQPGAHGDLPQRIQHCPRGIDDTGPRQSEFIPGQRQFRKHQKLHTLLRRFGRETNVVRNVPRHIPGTEADCAAAMIGLNSGAEHGAYLSKEFRHLFSWVACPERSIGTKPR